MIFKQGVLKEEKQKFSILLICSCLPMFVIILIALLNKTDLKILTFFISIFCIPLFLVILLIDFYNLEWYHIYEDRIEVRCIFGIKNIVCYNDVVSVDEVKINLTSRGMEKTFYIFNDGRRNNNNVLNVNSCYNKKRFNLRIYKTYELEKYIVDHLNLKVNRQSESV